MEIFFLRSTAVSWQFELVFEDELRPFVQDFKGITLIACLLTVNPSAQTEEDLKKKDEYQLLVTRVSDSDDGVVKLALETLRSEIKSSTSSMTAVPKPLKFLRPHYETLRNSADTMKAGPNKVCLRR